MKAKSSKKDDMLEKIAIDLALESRKYKTASDYALEVYKELEKCYEQGKKDGEKMKYARGFLDGNESGKETQLEYDKVAIRKQVLSEVLKEHKKIFGAISEERQGCNFVFRKKLEQKIKEMK